MNASLHHLAERESWFDLRIGFLLAIGVFALYIQSLVPSMLDGDPGHFQTILPVLGIPYPPGFPLYILLGHLWSWLPIGSVAYRINLFSAFWGALTVGAFFVALRRQRLLWLAALGSALTLAFVPPFWQYSTFAAEYMLHTFLAVMLLILLAEWETTQRETWLYLAMFAFGLGLSNHPTFLLFAPATALFLVLVGGRRLIEKPRLWLWNALLIALPLTLYLYLPIRANQIVSSSTLALPDWTIAGTQGIISPYYKNTLSGLLRYITAMSSHPNISLASGNWDTLIANWGTAVLEATSLPIVLCALVGAIRLAKDRAKLLVWLVGVLLTFGLITLQYVNSALASTVTDLIPYLSKFFLPGFISLLILAAWGVDTLLRWLPLALSRIGTHSLVASVVPSLLVVALCGIVWQELIGRHSP